MPGRSDEGSLASRGVSAIKRGARVLARPVLWEARTEQGFRYGQKLQPASNGRPFPSNAEPNPLLSYFDAHTEGPGIWKFRHYFEIYHRHFAKFVGQEVNVVEIGVYSGGSLNMWKEYFGERSHIHGVDIQEACRAYEDDRVSIHIGDQADPEFWRRFRAAVPDVDIVIDDGGHLVHQQVASLEALLPHLRPGGVYMCEDVGGIHNRFQAYVSGLSRNLASSFDATGFNQVVHSVHHYPFAIVIERQPDRVEGFPEGRHGTQWEPFLDGLHRAAWDG
jgi:hypothetical protein